VLSATHFDWTGSAAPWWVTPAVTLAAVWITARAGIRQDKSAERRKAVVDHREVVQKAFDIQPAGGFSSPPSEDKELELVLIDLGFRRFEVSRMTRVLRQHHNNNDSEILDNISEATLKDLIAMARRRQKYGAFQQVLGRYMAGEISLHRARRKLFSYRSRRRLGKLARRWAKGQYKAFH
jgi:hypothetical protein